MVPTVSNYAFKYALGSHAPAAIREEKKQRISHTHAMNILVRDYVQNRQLKHQRVTKVQVLDLLISRDVIVLPETEDIAVYKRQKLAALRSVQRLLKAK